MKTLEVDRRLDESDPCAVSTGRLTRSASGAWIPEDFSSLINAEHGVKTRHGRATALWSPRRLSSSISKILFVADALMPDGRRDHVRATIHHGYFQCVDRRGAGWLCGDLVVEKHEIAFVDKPCWAYELNSLGESRLANDLLSHRPFLEAVADDVYADAAYAFLAMDSNLAHASGDREPAGWRNGWRVAALIARARGLNEPYSDVYAGLRSEERGNRYQGCKRAFQNMLAELGWREASEWDILHCAPLARRILALRQRPCGQPYPLRWPLVIPQRFCFEPTPPRSHIGLNFGDPVIALANEPPRMMRHLEEAAALGQPRQDREGDVLRDFIDLMKQKAAAGRLAPQAPA